MKTLNEAIKDRLEENRRLRKQQAQRERERVAKEARIAAQVATEAKAILEKLHGFSLDDVEVTAVTYTYDYSYYYIHLAIPDDPTGHEVKTHSAVEVKRLAEYLPQMTWDGLHFQDNGDCAAHNHTDFLSAIIFAKYGTTEPEVAQ